VNFSSTNYIQVALFITTAASGIVGLIAKAHKEKASAKEKAKVTTFDWCVIGFISFTLIASITLEAVKANKEEIAKQAQTKLTQQLLEEIENTRYRFNTLLASPTYVFPEGKIPANLLAVYESGGIATAVGEQVLPLIGKAEQINTIEFRDPNSKGPDGHGKLLSHFCFNLWKAPAILMIPDKQSKNLRVIFKSIPIEQLLRTEQMNNARDFLGKPVALLQSNKDTAPYIVNVYLETDAGLNVQSNFHDIGTTYSYSDPLTEVTDPYNQAGKA
jgi:hypothetical protein